MPYCASTLQPQIIGVDSFDNHVVLFPSASRRPLSESLYRCTHLDMATWVATDTMNSYPSSPRRPKLFTAKVVCLKLRSSKDRVQDERSAGAFAPRKLGRRFHRWLRYHSASVPVLADLRGSRRGVYTFVAVLRGRRVGECTWPDHDAHTQIPFPGERCSTLQVVSDPHAVECFR